MKFGEYLKTRRTQLGWTQPEAAAKAGIEQSYLSKLETGKSLPSEDVYQRLADAFGITPEDMAGALFPGELDRLRDIGQIREHVLQDMRRAERVRQRWLHAGLAGLVLGGAMLGLAQVNRGGEATHYTYQSAGVILPGESLDVFAGMDDNPASGDADHDARIARRDALIARADERTIAIPDMRGPAFVETLPEGKRAWTLVGAAAVTTPDQFRWALVPGFALVIGGFGCFLVSWLRSRGPS